jgi:hypothetical protein
MSTPFELGAPPPATTRRRRSPARWLPRLLLVLLVIQVASWALVGRRSLVRSLPRMAGGDLRHFLLYGDARNWLEDENLPERRYFISHRLAVGLGRDGVEELAGSLGAFNGLLDVAGDPSSVLFSDPRACPDCVVVEYEEVWTTPFLAKARTIYSRPLRQTPHSWPLERRRPSLEREHVYLWCLGAWIRLRDRWLV